VPETTENIGTRFPHPGIVVHDENSPAGHAIPFSRASKISCTRPSTPSFS
jgi:hypothetical protein